MNPLFQLGFAVVALLVLAWLLFAYLIPTVREANRVAKEGRFGIIRKLKKAEKIRTKQPYTLLEIQEDGVNKIFYLGFEGFESDLNEGMQIQFWPSREDEIATWPYSKKVTNQDGTISHVKESQSYYRLNKYRILSEEKEAESQ